MIAAALLLTVTVRMVESQPLQHLHLKDTLPLLTVGCALDLASTEWALKQGPGMREANPLGQTLTSRALLQVGYLGAELAIVHTVDRKAGRKWGKRTLIGLTILKVGITGWNIHQGRKAGRAAR